MKTDYKALESAMIETSDADLTLYLLLCRLRLIQTISIETGKLDANGVQKLDDAIFMEMLYRELL